MPIANWLQETPKSRKKKSRNQEKKTARKLSRNGSEARVQAGSGSLYGNKGDVRTKVRLVELKRTDKDSIILKREWLEKIWKEAIKDGRTPVLGIEIGGKQYYICEESYWEG